MKIVLWLLCRLCWIFKDYEENNLFFFEIFVLLNIIKKKNVGFLEYICLWKSIFIFVLLFENCGILFLFEKWIGIGFLFIFKKRKYGILVVYFCYKWYCMVC